MNSTWKSLLWKEWREQRWRLVVLTGLLALLALWLFLSVTAEAISPITIGDYLSILSGFASCYIILAGCFLGMHVAGGENSQSTMRFIQSLPTPMWQAGLIKLLIAWLVAIVPLLLLYTVLYVILPLIVDKETLSPAIEQLRAFSRGSWQIEDLFEWSLLNTSIGFLGVTSLLLWMAAGGANRSDEVRAGAIGFLVCAGMWLPSLYLYGKVEQSSRFLGDILEHLVPILPGGPAFIPGFYLEGINLPGWLLILSALIFSHGAVLCWYFKRFGRVAIPSKRTGGFEFNLWLRMKTKTEPWKSQWHAIAWKQLRETGPLVALVVAVILLIVPIIYHFNSKNSSISYFGEILQGVSLSARFFVLIVAGIGVFIEDFAPGINNFWRSRPLNLNLWFVFKVAVGLFILSAAFGPLLLLSEGLKTRSNFSGVESLFKGILQVAQVLVLLYTFSLASYCLLRQPIYAAILTIGLFIFGRMLMCRLFPTSNDFITGSLVLFFAQAAALLIAYLAVKHDWGWKAGR